MVGIIILIFVRLVLQGHIILKTSRQLRIVVLLGLSPTDLLAVSSSPGGWWIVAVKDVVHLSWSVVIVVVDLVDGFEVEPFAVTGLPFTSTEHAKLGSATAVEVRMGTCGMSV